MSIGSPSAYLLWAILSVIFEVFLILHLWCYDRFKCIKWGSGRQPGAFKRVMTYSYLATLPLIMVFAVAITVIKFQEGYIVVPTERIIVPKPMSLWSESHRGWALPLFFVLAVAWSLEIVTHLEELTFWLFVLHQGPSKRDWFHSWEFRLWYSGSLIAAVGLPITTLMTRHHLDNCIAWIFLLGSSAGACTTLAFIYVIAKFPGFIRYVKSEGAIPDTVVRLVTFNQFNLIRMAFRVMFNFPLMVIGLDGVRGSHPVVLDRFWPDFLLMLGGIGCVVSSVITLLIFFPRSITNESGYNARIPSANSGKGHPMVRSSPLPEYNQHVEPHSPLSALNNPYRHSHMSSFRFPAGDLQEHRRHYSEGEATPEYESDPERHRTEEASPSSPPRPGNSKAGNPPPAEQVLHISATWRDDDSPYPYERQKFSEQQAMQIEGIGSGSALAPIVHPYVMNFTSPIDLLDRPSSAAGLPPIA